MATIICGPSGGPDLPSVPTPPDLRRIDVRQTVFFKRYKYYWLPHLAYRAPVVVLSFDLRTLSNYPVILWRTITGAPFILWGHGLSRRKNSPKWAIPLRRWLAHWATALIFYSEAGQQDFVDMGISQEKLFVAPNTIDIGLIQEAIDSVKEGLPRDQILYIGRLIAAKKVDLLIKAFALIHDQLPQNIGLTIIGDGPERSTLESLVHSFGIGNKVTFAGQITKEKDLAPHFARALLSVSPGYIGLSAVHSQAYGVPLLVSRDEPHSPEIDAIVPNVTGRFFAPNTPEALATALGEMLSDSDTLTAMSQTARESIEESYSLDKMVEAFRSAYEYATNKAP